MVFFHNLALEKEMKFIASFMCDCIGFGFHTLSFVRLLARSLFHSHTNIHFPIISYIQKQNQPKKNIFIPIIPFHCRLFEFKHHFTLIYSEFKLKMNQNAVKSRKYINSTHAPRAQIFHCFNDRSHYIILYV